MKMRKYVVSVLTAAIVILICLGVRYRMQTDDTKVLKIGFIYNGDYSNAYSANFMKAQQDIEEKFGDRVETVSKYNVTDSLERNDIQSALDDLAAQNCDLIFATSYSYQDCVKKYATKYPDIQFCMATGDNTNTGEIIPNYHTFMGRIYEGRYACGVVAGMKLKELIDKGELTEDEALLGYVGAFPYAEVISGYTAYYLGAASVVPGVKMKVCYTNSWNDYTLEKKYAERLIEEGCIIISQHSDTAGVATACEKTDSSVNVFAISYNKGMSDVAPTTYLTGCRINWSPYMCSAVDAMLRGKEIEAVVSGSVQGKDVGAGFDHDWVSMLEINELIAAPGTKEKVERTIKQFKKHELHVFKGSYKGVNPDNPLDTIDLAEEYVENANQSAPTFRYVLEDVIEIMQWDDK